MEKITTNIKEQWEFLIMEKFGHNTCITANDLIRSCKENIKIWGCINFNKEEKYKPKNADATIRFCCKKLELEGALEKVEGEKSTWKASKNFLSYFKEIIIKIAKPREMTINLNDPSNYLMRAANEINGVQADILTEKEMEKLNELIINYDLAFGGYYSDQILD